MMGIEDQVIRESTKETVPDFLQEDSEIQELIEESEVKGERYIEKPDVAYIERTSRLAIIEQSRFDENTIVKSDAMKSKFETVKGVESQHGEEKIDELTLEQRNEIKEETGWSYQIIENIKNVKQYEILKNGGLVEVTINGKPCLIKENINLDYTDADGISNRDRIARGLAPLDSKSEKPLELHHLGQKVDSPLVELTEEEHRTGEYEDGKKNQSLWHDNTVKTEVHGEGNNWDQERKAHWKERFEQVGGQ